MSEFDLEAEDRLKAYQDRAVLELLLRLPAGLLPGEVWDLGCGDGEYAAMLARRYPAAQVFGLEADPALLARARRRPGAIEWLEGEPQDFVPSAPPGLVFAADLSADQAKLAPRWAGALAPGGVLALSVDGAGPDPHALYEVLAGLCGRIDIWRTAYLLPGEATLVERLFIVAVR